MELSVFTSFVLATALMIALPGPSVLLTVAHSLSFGWRQALVTVCGATLGIAIQLLVAIVGIGGLIGFVAATFDLLRWVGAGYLVYVGARVWINASELAKPGEPSGDRPDGLLVQGFVVTVLNPKSLLFIAAFLPQFLDVRRSLGAQFLVIVPVFLLLTFVVTAMWALLPGIANGRIRGSGKLVVIFRLAAVLIALSGVGMGFVQHGA